MPDDSVVGGSIGASAAWHRALNATYRIPDNVANDLMLLFPDRTPALQIFDRIGATNESDTTFIKQYASEFARQTKVVTGCTSAASQTPTLASGEGILIGTVLINLNRAEAALVSSVTGAIPTLGTRGLGDSDAAAWVANDDIIVMPVNLPENADNGPVISKGTSSRTLNIGQIWRGTSFTVHEALRAKRGPDERARILGEQFPREWKMDKEYNLILGYGGENTDTSYQPYRFGTGLVQQIENDSAVVIYQGEHIDYDTLCAMFDAASEYGEGENKFLLTSKAEANWISRNLYKDFGVVSIEITQLNNQVLGVDLRTYQVGSGTVTVAWSDVLRANAIKNNGYMFSLMDIQMHQFMGDMEANNERINPHILREAYGIVCSQALSVAPKKTAWCKKATS